MFLPMVVVPDRKYCSASALLARCPWPSAILWTEVLLWRVCSFWVPPDQSPQWRRRLPFLVQRIVSDGAVFRFWTWRLSVLPALGYRRILEDKLHTRRGPVAVLGSVFVLATQEVVVVVPLPFPSGAVH